MRFFVETYGCTMNHGESLEMERTLALLGHSIAATAEDAEIVVVNTCVVIKSTELKIMKRMRQLQEKGKRFIVTGCMAAVQASEITEGFPETLLLAPSNHDSFAGLIVERYGIGDCKADPSKRLFGSTFILPIAQGCLGHCTYCITRLARGGLKSYPIGELVGSATEALNEGAKELFVTAQDTACYGKDSGTRLADLISGLCGFQGDFKIRIGMMNPDSLKGQESDLAQMYQEAKVYKFLHLPVQSGSDRMLKAMGRAYKVAEFEEQVQIMRRAVPRLTLSTDIICGFPGEEEADHRDTIAMLLRVRPNIVNVTRFSIRLGTAAESMDHQVVSRIAKDRSREIAKLRFEIASSINAKLIGECLDAVATEEGKNGTTICRDLAFVPIAIPVRLSLGSNVKIVVTQSHPTYLVGRLAE